MKPRFAGKVAWITGASSGLGRACALELGRQGASVVVSGRRRDRLASLRHESRAIALAGGTKWTTRPDGEQAFATSGELLKTLSRGEGI